MKVHNPILNSDYSKLLHDRKLIAIFALCLLSIAFLAVAIGYFINTPRYTAVMPTAEHVPNELIVLYKEGTSPHELSEGELEDLNTKLSDLGVVSQEKAYSQVESGELTRSYKLKLQKDIDLVRVQEMLSSINGILSSQPNFIYHTFVTPNDPQYSSLWGIQKISSPLAWDTGTGSKSVVVAVIDTGMDINHADLAGISTNPYSAISGGSNVSDGVGHGTHVAGTIGAIGNNGVGVVGVNWNVSIMPIQVCSPGGCDMAAIVNGIYRAADNGAKVINMSLGTRAPGVDRCSSAQDTYKAIQHALSKGVTVVVAAGNDSRDASLTAPASCAGVITVGASTQNDGSSSFTNFGSVVDIAAPGVGILSTFPGGYKSENGTSMSSPHVAGAAALLLSLNPSLTPQQVESCLVDSADAISSARPIGPRLNIASAISACGSGGSLPTATPTTALNPTVSPTQSAVRYYISGRVFEDNNKDGVYNSGDLGLSGKTLSLSGSFSDTTSTLTDGTFIFDNLFAGTFNVTYESSSRNGINLTAQSPAAVVNFIVTKDTINPTPTIVAGEPSPPVNPTATAVPTRAPTNVPSPTPQLFTCEFDPTCESSQSNIQLCPLVCKPK